MSMNGSRRYGYPPVSREGDAERISAMYGLLMTVSLQSFLSHYHIDRYIVRQGQSQLRWEEHCACRGP